MIISLSKIPGENYRPNSFKVYNLIRDGQLVGVLEQAPNRWEVRDLALKVVGTHSTIKAAARTARKVF